MITIKHFINVTLGFIIISCGSKERTSEASDQIIGVYAREYSFTVTNPESGKEIGMSTIRDTIFIEPLEKAYKVSNNKWRLNDYDKDGWKNMEHSEDRPLPTYNAVFDPTTHSLNAELMAQLYLNLETRKLYKGKKSDKPYNRVR